MFFLPIWLDSTNLLRAVCKSIKGRIYSTECNSSARLANAWCIAVTPRWLALWNLWVPRTSPKENGWDWPWTSQGASMMAQLLGSKDAQIPKDIVAHCPRWCPCRAISSSSVTEGHRAHLDHLEFWQLSVSPRWKGDSTSIVLKSMACSCEPRFGQTTKK